MKIRKLLSGALAALLVFSCALSVPSLAATEKGIVGTIKGGSNISSGANIEYWGPEGDLTDSTGYTVSYDLYVPTTILEKNQPGLHVDTCLPFWLESEGKGGQLLAESFDFGLDEEIWVNHWDEATQTDMDAPYATVTKVDDMYKVTVTDITVDSKLYSDEWDDSINGFKEWTDAVPTSTGISARVSIYKDSSKSFSTKFSVTNVVIKKNGEVVFTSDVSVSDKIGGTYTNADDIYTESAAQSFNTKGLTVSKTKATIKKGKKTTAKVTTMFNGDKVTVKTSKKKVATASYKNGKVTIKGVKKGKATITVSSAYGKKTIKVTVKK